MAAIKRVEILRDGAAARYGSDAIAAVINIVLKDRTGLQVEAGAGRYYESNNNVYGFLDTFKASLNGGLSILDRGVLYPDKWGVDAGGVFYEAGFTYGWETLPFGINGGYYYLNLAYTY